MAAGYHADNLVVPHILFGIKVRSCLRLSTVPTVFTPILSKIHLIQSRHDWNWM